MDIGFDVISDLRLDPEESFNWEGKQTSLYCLVPGNVSSDLRTVLQTLAHLGKLYQGVFYTPGPLEYTDTSDIVVRTEHIINICSKIHNVAVLHHNVVLVDGVAIIGANGWCVDSNDWPKEMRGQIESARIEDTAYLLKGIEKLQRHLDVKKIIVTTNGVPDRNLFFGQEPEFIQHTIPLSHALETDTEAKVSHWVFGTYDKIVDTELGNINFVNNSYYKKNPYWAKRITIEF